MAAPNNEMEAAAEEALTPPPPSYPPYPPYSLVTEPASVADTIRTGHVMRLEHKTAPRMPVHPSPNPVRPRGTKATDVRLTRKQRRAHALCLRRYKTMLTDRLEQMSKPPRRNILALWRDHNQNLPSHTIAKLRRMLDADEPFKPDQAYEYFINLRKIERIKKSKRKICGLRKSDTAAVCQHKRFLWARNATVAFARGIQRRLLTPGCYNLADGMLRLSNVILNDMCRYMHTRVPSRKSKHPKDKLMMEVSDKVACWIDEILAESDDRMLMMDFDEDEDILSRCRGRPGDADDFLNMMGGDSDTDGSKSRYGKAASKLKGKKLEAFKILTSAMNNRGQDELITYGKNKQTYVEGAEELVTASDFDAKDASRTVADKLKKDLAKTVEPVTPSKLASHMPEIIDLASNYLAQVAEYNKDKGPAFKLLLQEMQKKPDEMLYEKGRAKRTYGQAAIELKEAKGLYTNHEDPDLANEVYVKLDKTVEGVTPSNLQKEMKEALDMSSKYLSQRAVDELDKGVAFELLVTELDKQGVDNFHPETEHLKKKLQAAKALKSSVALFVPEPDPETAPQLKSNLHLVVKDVTPVEMKEEMEDTIEKTGNYLSVFNLHGGNVSESDAKKGTESDAERERRLREEELRRQEELRKLEEQRRHAERDGKSDAESDAERERRLREEELRRQAELKRLEELRRQEELRRLKELRHQGTSLDGGDKDRLQALDILHKQLQAKGGETFYQQPPTELAHNQASNWLSKDPPETVDKTVKEAGDTARLHKKFERRLSALVNKITPPHLVDPMQDVTIESARALSEYFVAKNYKTMARDALISGMQNKENEILAEEDGGAESFFFAAQRLKRTDTFETKEPCHEVSNKLSKKMKEAMRHSTMPRKLCNSVKAQCEEAADFLSEFANKPAPKIEAYVRLLQEMETAGDADLVTGNISKSHQDAAKYLKQLTTYEDLINRPNASMKSAVEKKLKKLMAQVPPSGYTSSDMDDVISENAKLLTSYIMHQEEKTEALKYLVEKMGEEKDALLLRHGEVRKSFVDGAEKLRGKNTDQLRGNKGDPVVGRKIEIKLHNLMQNKTPQKFANIMDDVIEDATNYIAVNLLQPQRIQVCKCMKNVFVQCELWCDEILRRFARPCCSCSRHVSKSALQSLAPHNAVHLIPGTTRAVGPGIDINVLPCPSKTRPGSIHRRGPCPASHPTTGCQQIQANFLLLSNINDEDEEIEPTKLSPESSHEDLEISTSSIHSSGNKVYGQTSFYAPSKDLTSQQSRMTLDNALVYHSFQQNTTFPSSSRDSQKSFDVQAIQHSLESPFSMPSSIKQQSKSATSSIEINNDSFEIDIKEIPHPSTISTDKMTDWHAMMVSLMWNVQTWRNWLQEIIEQILSYQTDCFITPDEAKDSWEVFCKNHQTETSQWLQYHTFIRQLSLRLDLRYRDKKIFSPSRSSEKTKSYKECQEQMLEIYGMLKEWSQRIFIIVKETNARDKDTESEQNVSDTNTYDLRWINLKHSIGAIYDDWLKSSLHLKVFWQQKYGSVVSEWVGAWRSSAPVWVVCAGGAVPSGAVAGGTLDGEALWVARTTHRGRVLPAALVPTQQCCLVYADSQVYRYSHYQVMCNADVKWLAYRAGPIMNGAVRVAAGVHVGRVLYRGSHLIGAVKSPVNRCHVVIFGRPFAFSCFELLIHADNPGE